MSQQPQASMYIFVSILQRSNLELGFAEGTSPTNLVDQLSPRPNNSQRVNPRRKPGRPWTREEEDFLTELVDQGFGWKAMVPLFAKEFESRSASALCNRNTFLKQRNASLDPTEALLNSVDSNSADNDEIRSELAATPSLPAEVGSNCDTARRDGDALGQGGDVLLDQISRENQDRQQRLQIKRARLARLKEEIAKAERIGAEEEELDKERKAEEARLNELFGKTRDA